RHLFLPGPTSVSALPRPCLYSSLFFTAPPPTEIYTLSLHDALPISWHGTTILAVRKNGAVVVAGDGQVSLQQTIIKPNARKVRRDRKSTRLNSSHVSISYAVFCLKKKNKTRARQVTREPPPVPGRP